MPARLYHIAHTFILLTGHLLGLKCLQCLTMFFPKRWEALHLGICMGMIQGTYKLSCSIKESNGSLGKAYLFHWKAVLLVMEHLWNKRQSDAKGNLSSAFWGILHSFSLRILFLILFLLFNRLIPQLLLILLNVYIYCGITGCILNGIVAPECQTNRLKQNLGSTVRASASL